MLAKMQKVTLVGERTNLKKVIDALKATGNFQITFYKSTGNQLPPDEAIRKTQLTQDLNTVSGLLTYLKADTKPLTMTYAELQRVTKQQKKIDQLITKLTATKNAVADLNHQVQSAQTTIEQLQPFAELPIAASLLHHTRSAFVLAGSMAPTDFSRFQNDLGTNDFLCETYPTRHKKLLVVLTGEQTNLPLATAIYDYGWTPFPEQYTFNRTPAAQIAHLTRTQQELAEQIKTLQTKNQPTAAQINLLKTYHDYLLNELDTLSILTATIQTKTCFVVHGWLPAKMATAFTELLHHTDRHVVVELKDATTTDNPPALMRNTPLVAPYQSITAMYGLPGRTDLDPNPFVALFYFLFFGMMFGDVAYGILLSLVTAGILIFKRPRGGMRQMLALFLMGGLSAALWGLVFNSWFGLQLPSIMMPRTIISPIGNDAILFFALSLYLGVMQLTVGALLNVINLLRQKQWLDGLCRGLPPLVFFVGLTLAFPTLISLIITLDYPFMAWFQPLMLPGVITLAVGFAGLVLLNGVGKKISGYLVGMFTGAYKVINYFSDILSYARLFGVGLVGCVIAYVANYLFGMFAGIGWFGYILGAVVAVIFHALNIALGLLSTYIHNARLQFVEFFGKFYVGDGVAFTPLGSQLRYIRLQGQGVV